MTLALRAVYEHGKLRLLDPVQLAEGQEIQLMILSDKEQARAVLGDLLVQFIDPVDEDIDEAELARIIEEGFQGQPSLSEAIIKERREGP
jgi:predicted DNA-binding antitoxin AbrB/MazE fold protein